MSIQSSSNKDECSRADQGAKKFLHLIDFQTDYDKSHFPSFPQESTYQAGETAILNCSFYLHSDQLYSVKWYKVQFMFNIL